MFLNISRMKNFRSLRTILKNFSKCSVNVLEIILNYDHEIFDKTFPQYFTIFDKSIP